MQTQILGMPLPIKIEYSKIEMFNRCFILCKKVIWLSLLPIQSNFNLRFCWILCTGIQERWKQLFWYLLQVLFLKYMSLLMQLRPLLSFQTFLKCDTNYFLLSVCVLFWKLIWRVEVCVPLGVLFDKIMNKQ